MPTLRQKILQSKMLQMRVEKQLLHLLRLIMTITKRRLKKPRLEMPRWRITAFLAQKRLKVPSCDRIRSSWTGFRPTWTITLIKRTRPRQLADLSVLAMLPIARGVSTYHREAAKETSTWRRLIRPRCSTNRKWRT